MNNPIAITGIGCRFPGGADSPDAFWRLLCDGVDAVTEIPASRWPIHFYYDPERGKPGKTVSKWGGFIAGVDEFDAGFFGITDAEAVAMDPQQRLMLEVAWEALDDAGLAPGGSSGATGVFIGASTHDYELVQRFMSEGGETSPYAATGLAGSIIANRISHALDLQGPSLVVDTACSSSLLAVHLACRSVWARECAVAVAGGVNCLISADNFIAFSSMGLLSPEGRCRSFDSGANGFVRGEGAGAIVLRPLEDAIADGNPVYAVICATGTNQDGTTPGIAFPSHGSQCRLLRETLAEAGLAGEALAYVEAHGTGTMAGDPVEASALGDVLGKGRPVGGELLIGSVKTNIGHLESAAGIAGLIKCALCLKHGATPPSLHFESPNPAIDFAGLGLSVPTRLTPFEGRRQAPDGTVYAGVNSFGFGGSNAFALLQSHSQDPDFASSAGSIGDDGGERRLLPLSARSPESLRVLARSYAAFLGECEATGSAGVDDIVFTAANRRAHHPHRLALTGSSRGEFRDKLTRFAEGELTEGIFAGTSREGSGPVFVFSGQGSQWQAMGRKLFQKENVFREAIERCDEAILRIGGWSLIREMFAEEGEPIIRETAIAQPSIFAIQVALSAQFSAWGILPSAVVGHSVGEVAAAYVAGVFDFDDAVRLIERRGATMAKATGAYAMLAAALSPGQAEELIPVVEGTVCLAAINGPASITLSGPVEAMRGVASQLDQSGVWCRFVPVPCGFHSSQMDPLRTCLVESLGILAAKPAEIPLYSTVTGGRVEGTELGTDYWWRNVRDPVRFAPAIESLMRDGYTDFVEVSGHPVLSPSIRQTLRRSLGESDFNVIATLRRGEPERESLLGAAGQLHCLGREVDWSTLAPRSPGRQIRLPRYPWQHRRYWSETSAWTLLKTSGPLHPLLAHRRNTGEPGWRSTISLKRLPYLKDHAIRERPVFPASGYLEIAHAAASELFPGQAIRISDVEFERALFVPQDGKPTGLEVRLCSAGSQFEISSNAGTDPGGWTRHVRGCIAPLPNRTAPGKEDLSAVRGRCDELIGAGRFYARARQWSFHYGPAFQGVREVFRRNGEALGRIELPEAARSHGDGYQLHPVTLDACLQLGFEVMDESDPQAPIGMFLPQGIETISVFAPLPGTFFAQAKMLRQGRSFLEIEIRALSEDGSVLLRMEGVRYRPLEGADESNFIHWFYHHEWVLKSRPPEPVDHFPSGDGGVCPHLAEIGPALLEKGAALDRRFRLTSTLVSSREGVERYWRGSILAALFELGWQPEPDDLVSPQALIEGLALRNDAGPLLGRCFRGLAGEGVLTPLDEPLAWRISADLRSIHDPMTSWRSLMGAFPTLHGELMMLKHAAEILPRFLAGETVEPTRQTGEFARLVAGTRNSGLTWLASNLLLREAVARSTASLPRGRVFRVLEVGAAHGGFFSHLAGELAHLPAEFVVSDPSPSLPAEFEDLVHHSGFAGIRQFDPWRDPRSQGFEGCFDLIAAQDLLTVGDAATPLLRNLGELLAPGGLLVFSGVIPGSWISDLGWVFGSAAHPESAAACSGGSEAPDPAAWIKEIAADGYSAPVVVNLTVPETFPGRGVFLTRKAIPIREVDGAASRARPSERPSGPDTWLILADSGGVGNRLAETLEAQGERSIVLKPGDPPNRLEEALARGIGAVVHLGSLDLPSNRELSRAALERSRENGAQSVLALLRGIQEYSGQHGHPRLWIVTRSAHSVDSDDSQVEVSLTPLAGMVRVIANEMPALRCRAIDLGSHSTVDEDVVGLMSEFLIDDGESEVALRGRGRYVARVVRDSSLDANVPAERGHARDLPAKLSAGGLGMLHHLRMRPHARRAPGPGEVEIEVRVGALNFRDVMKALGIYPGNAPDAGELGDEFAGVIVRTGAGVETPKVGDRVFGVRSGAMATHLTLPSGACLPIPESLTFEESATIPVAYLTAHHALNELAGMRAGERVLIHSGAGGVGLAAIRLALRAGLEVYATAGSPMKRQFLRNLGVRHVSNSRTLDFADEILAVTNGEGVDIVLNSLAGEAIPRSLGILREFGRFLEIGKRDIYSGASLNLRPFKNCLSYFAIDLSRWITGSEGFLKDRLAALLETERVAPIPFRAFPVGEVARAFQFMAQGHHIGKVLLQFDPLPMVRQEGYRSSRVRFRGDVTYLVTGGLRGLGFAFAGHLCRRGARNLVLTSLSGECSEEVESILAGLRAEGVRILVRRSDVASETDLSELLAEIAESMPPLGGVIHTATAYRDAFLKEMTPDAFEAVMRAKAYGAWNLHWQTKDLPIELFVMTSSISSVIGNPGQANYVAANSFLEGLARYRRRIGLPALAIQLDRITDVGHVSRNETLSDHFTRLRWTGISADQAMEAMDRLLANGAEVGLITSCTWRKDEGGAASWCASPRFENLIRASLTSNLSEDPNGLRNRLGASSPEERVQLVGRMLIEEIAAVLRKPVAKVPANQPLRELGLDSLMTVELMARLEPKIGTSIPAHQISDVTTVEALSHSVLAGLGFDPGQRPLESGQLC
jgi:acyl transferase domain-containing protein/NADPH:quinone reductase-like Zn-dependent oxidoreductase/acyl carrier protein